MIFIKLVHHLQLHLVRDVVTWVCIAEHESQLNTSAIGRLNTDGSIDHGVFQINDRYWCENNEYGGKACNLPCEKLLDDDLRDDVACIRTIHEEHTRLSGDGFNAWTVYKPHCKNQNTEHITSCFDAKTLSSVEVMESFPSYNVSGTEIKGRIYTKCELAQEIYYKHHMSMEQIPKWVCIAEHESSFNTAAVGRLNADGSANHGLFQISDLYWCSHGQYGGKACNIPCKKLLDSDITDDVRCIKVIYEEHTRIFGDGFNAWTVYNPHCRNASLNYIKECFTEKELKILQTTRSPFNNNSLIPQNSFESKSTVKSKIYKKCELAQELYREHFIPMEQIPKWVCIAQHESSYNTAAVGRLNTDGSADHGLFQISDLYWCSHDQYGSKACNIPCKKLLDSDITDDVRCIKIIYEEHTRISGDGFNAWTVYKPHCRNTDLNHIKECFTEKELKASTKPITFNTTESYYSPSSKNTPKGKIYKKCELAQELLSKYNMPAEQIPTWVCIAQHVSAFNTSAVGRFNKDNSLDHGLFQISNLYWCSHNQYGGKACNIPCDRLLDSDIADDVKCIKIIHEEHSRISGDGFNAWSVYEPHCRNRKIEDISSCFELNQIEIIEKNLTQSGKTAQIQPFQQVPPKSLYSNNPFLGDRSASQIGQKQYEEQNFRVKTQSQKPSYANNPFLKNFNNNQTKPSPKHYNESSNLSHNNLVLKSSKNHSQKFLSASNKLAHTVQPSHSTFGNNAVLNTTPSYNLKITANYLDSNYFRNTTLKPTSLTTNLPTTTPKNTYSKIKHTSSTTTENPITTKTSIPKSTLQRNVTTSKPKTTTNNLLTTTWTKHFPRPTTSSTSATNVLKTTPTWSWQTQNYQTSISSKAPNRTPKKINGQNENNNSTKTAPKTTSSWSWKSEKSTNFKEQTTTTTPTRPVSKFKNEQISGTPKTKTTNLLNLHKTTTSKTSIATTTTTRRPTQKTTPKINWRTPVTTTRKSTTSPTKRTYYTDNLKPTTIKSHTTAATKANPMKNLYTTTMTRKPLATKSASNGEYNKYKNDPFSHPFFAKVNEQFKQLRSNNTTTKRPSFSAS